MSVSAPVAPSGSDLRVRPVDASEIGLATNPATGDATVRAQETRGSDTRSELVIASGAKVSSGKVAALRTEIQNAYDMNGNDLAAKVGALNVAERNELLRTLSTSGIAQLTFEFAQTRTGNPRAYTQLQHDLLSGQPPAQIQRIVNAALAWDVPGNPVGQNMAQGLVHDTAAYIAANGTKGQKLGLIDNLADPGGQGLAARKGTAAEAVGELFKGLRDDPAAVTRALASMSRADMAAVAEQTVRTDDAAGISTVLRMAGLGQDVLKRNEMTGQFVAQAHATDGAKRLALANGVIRNFADPINASGKSHGVVPAAIGAILYQEIATRDAPDAVQDRLAAQIANTPPGSQQRADTIAAANRDGNVNPLPFGDKDITRSTTLGAAQLSVDGVVRLFGGAWNGQAYVPAAAGSADAKNFLPGVMSREQFFRDPVGNSMKLLTNPALAPTLVGAWSERIITLRERNPNNESIGSAPAGATPAARQERETLQYRYLSGSYSSGGNFKSVLGQPVGTGGLDETRTRNPSRFPPGQLSPGEQAATSRRALIEQLLR